MITEENEFPESSKENTMIRRVVICIRFVTYVILTVVKMTLR